MTNCAVVPLTGAVPRIAAPSRKVTVPVGALPAMVAVRVVGDPTAPGLGVTESVVVASLDSLIFMTKAPTPALAFNAAWNAPAVVGKSVFDVMPVT